MREKTIKDLTAQEIESVAEAVGSVWRNVAMYLDVDRKLGNRLNSGSSPLMASRELMKVLKEDGISIKTFKVAFGKVAPGYLHKVASILSQEEIDSSATPAPVQKEMTGTLLSAHSAELREQLAMIVCQHISTVAAQLEKISGIKNIFDQVESTVQQPCAPITLGKAFIKFCVQNGVTLEAMYDACRQSSAPGIVYCHSGTPLDAAFKAIIAARSNPQPAVQPQAVVVQIPQKQDDIRILAKLIGDKASDILAHIKRGTQGSLHIDLSKTHGEETQAHQLLRELSDKKISFNTLLFAIATCNPGALIAMSDCINMNTCYLFNGCSIDDIMKTAKDAQALSSQSPY